MSILSSSTRLLPVVTPSARWKVYAMPPTMTSVSTLSSRLSITSILPEIFGAADDGHEGFLRRFERLAEIGDFLFHQQAGHGGFEKCVMPSVEACARCAEPKASFT